MRNKFDIPLSRSPNSSKSLTDSCSMHMLNLSNQSLCIGSVSQTVHADNTSKSLVNPCSIDSSPGSARTLHNVNDKYKGLKTKPFHIALEPKIHTNDTKIPSKNTTKNFDHPQDVFLSYMEENIFTDVFSDFIHRIRSGVPINKNSVWERANDSVEFRPVLTGLRQRFSNERINKTLLIMIRTVEFNGQFGMCNGLVQLHKTSGTLNLSDNTQKYFRSASHRKSIFFLKEDELLFRCIFSDLINKIANNKSFPEKLSLQELTIPDFLM